MVIPASPSFLDSLVLQNTLAKMLQNRSTTCVICFLPKSMREVVPEASDDLGILGYGLK